MGSQFKRIMSLKKVLMLSFARPCRGRKPQRAESDRRRRLRDPLRQPGIRQQRFQRIADALQRPLHTPHRRGMDGEKPADLRRRPPAELRAAQRRPRTVPERRETARYTTSSTARTYRPTPVSSTARSCWAIIRGRSSATRRRSTTTACRVSSGIINPPSARIPM